MKQDAGKCLLEHVVIGYCKKHKVTLTAYEDNAGGGATCTLPNNISGKNQGCSPPREGKGQLPPYDWKMAITNVQNTTEFQADLVKC